MSTPEPLDEHPAGGIEIRGGDRPEDYLPRSDVMFHAQEDLLRCGPDCDCGEDEPE
jgi:hypothetical protein